MTWKNDDGTVIEEDEGVEYGTTPSYDSDTPTKAATAEFTYVFEKWMPEIVKVIEDAAYTAVYTSTPNSYTVKYVYEGDVPPGAAAPADRKAEYGSEVTVEPAPDDVEGYTFKGWDRKESFTMPANDVTITGIWEKDPEPVPEEPLQSLQTRELQNLTIQQLRTMMYRLMMEKTSSKNLFLSQNRKDTGLWST